MSIDHLVHFVGNRSPSITDTITVNGVAFDLTGSTVKLQMRLVGSSTLKIDTAASIVSAPAGTVRYDPAAVDVDTLGFYTAWWRVTLPGGTIQDTPEFLVEIRPHAPATPTDYISVAEIKSTLAIQKGFADSDIQRACTAASRAVDSVCSRFFYLTTSQQRKYTVIDPGYVSVDDATTVTAISDNGTTLTLGTHYLLEPANAALESPAQPYTGIRANFSYFFISYGFPQTFLVTGTWGWPAVPVPVVKATSILASRLLRRAREATFGVVGLGFESGAVEIATFDPDINLMLEPYKRSTLGTV